MTSVPTNDLAEAHRNDAPLAVASLVVEKKPLRLAIAGLIVAALLGAAYLQFGQGEGAAQSFSLLFGVLVGIVLQRSRFCFFCMFNDWFERRDARGLLGLIVALAVGSIATALVFTLWLPDPAAGRLPPQAFIGPVSIVLVVAGLAFGAGMAISGSCVSAHLYRLGEGSPTAPFALIGTVAGFIAGFLTWNPLYLAAIAAAPVVWLPAKLGYAGWLVVTLALLAVLAWLLSRGSQEVEVASRLQWHEAIFTARWPAWIGGLAIGVIAAASYLRVAPLGVTAEIGARARQLADAASLLPSRLEGLDTLRGCVAVIRDAALTPNGFFVIALVLASFAAAVAAGQFRPQWPTLSQVVRGFLGGLLLGWGAMTGLGCTIGTLFSGITAGALSGWVFGIAVFASVAVCLRIKRSALQS